MASFIVILRPARGTELDDKAYGFWESDDSEPVHPERMPRHLVRIMEFLELWKLANGELAYIHLMQVHSPGTAFDQSHNKRSLNGEEGC